MKVESFSNKFVSNIGDYYKLFFVIDILNVICSIHLKICIKSYV